MSPSFYLDLPFLFREALAALAVFAFSIWALSVFYLHVFRQLHHVWYGVGVLLFGVWHYGNWFDVPVWLLGLGILVMLDDSYQHARQVLTGDLEYRSPGWHVGRVLFYEPLVKVRGFVKLIQPYATKTGIFHFGVAFGRDRWRDGYFLDVNFAIWRAGLFVSSIGLVRFRDG